jgi:quercetin dioxygenase-like cupin family protein
LPEELEKQAIAHAFGILDPEDRQAFMVRLQGESDLLRQAARAYHATTGALADAVVPVTPPATLRERLANQVALEASREAEQFELAANTLALGSAPVKPRDSLRDRLISRIEGQADIRLELRDSARVLGETSMSSGYGRVEENRTSLHQNTGSQTAWLWSFWQPIWNLLRTVFARFVAPRPSAHGLTFVKASEGTWHNIAPGVVAKVLSYDSISRRATSLVRIAPGISYAPHRHATAEELFVLEGGCFCGGRELKVGDYHRAEAGTEHHDTSSDDGCLLLVISSPHNEMLSSHHP